MTDDGEDDFADDESEDDGYSETIACPSCGADVYEDAEQCPVCGDYIVPGGGSAWDGKPLWWVLLGLAGIAAVVWALA